MKETSNEPIRPGGPQPSAMPSAGAPDPAGWVTLVKCGTLVEADAVRAQLEAAEIKCFLPDEALMQTVAWNVNTYGYIRVQVRAQDYDLAQQLLGSMGPGEGETTTEPRVKAAERPLSWPMKWLAFAMPLLTFPGFLMFAMARSAYLKQGCDRKARELWHWFAAGLVVWGIAFIVFVSAVGAAK